MNDDNRWELMEMGIWIRIRKLIGIGMAKVKESKQNKCSLSIKQMEIYLYLWVELSFRTDTHTYAHSHLHIQRNSYTYTQQQTCSCTKSENENLNKISTNYDSNERGGRIGGRKERRIFLVTHETWTNQFWWKLFYVTFCNKWKRIREDEKEEEDECQVWRQDKGLMKH